MSDCEICGSTISASEAFCRFCRPNRSEPDGHSLADSGVPVARFRNGAEAGYFAEELARETGIELEISTRERMDGVHGAWRIDYVLVASAAEADRAAQSLHALVRRLDEEDASRGDDTAEAEQPAGPVWVPLMLTLAAGSIALWGIERLDLGGRQRPPALVDRDPREPPNLWHVLGATPGAWVQQAADGRARRSLTVLPEERMAVLREDQNGDGTFEREWRFDLERLADAPRGQ